MYGAVFFFFFVRFVYLRKWSSLLLAMTSPIGWVLVALWDLGLMTPLPSAPARWLGVVSGVMLLHSVVKLERQNPEQKHGTMFDKDR